MLQQIKEPQFYTDLGLKNSVESVESVLNPPVNGKIQGLFKAFECFQVLFKENLIFQDFSRQSCISKYFSRQI